MEWGLLVVGSLLIRYAVVWKAWSKNLKGKVDCERRVRPMSTMWQCLHLATTFFMMSM